MSNITSITVSKDHIGIVKAECNGSEHDLSVTLASAMLENILLARVIHRAATMTQLVVAVDAKNAQRHE